MPNIPSRPAIDQFFARTVARASSKRGYYAAIHRQAIQLRSVPFLVYSQIARAADFRTRMCNIRRLVWPWRRIRTHRQVNRILADLSRCLLDRHDRLTYSLRGRTYKLSEARLRPVRFHVLAEAQDAPRALLVRFLLFLAWSRVPWSWLRVGSIQKGLHVDRNVAHQLYRWLRGPGRRYTRAQVRRAVFWSTSPRLRLYRPDRNDPRGFHAQTRPAPLERSGNVHPPTLAIMGSIQALTKRLTGSGGRPPPGAVDAAQARSQRQQSAAIVAGLVRAMGQGGGGTPPAPPAALRRMEGTDARAGGDGSQLTAEKLVAGMPLRMRQDMRRKIRYLEAKAGRG